MKMNLTITKSLIAIIGLTLTSCSTWHYNTPRVSVDRVKTNTITTQPNSSVEIPVTHEPVVANKKVVMTEHAIYNKPAQKDVIQVKDTKAKTAVLSTTQTTEKKSLFTTLTEKIAQKKNLLKVAKSEKTAASGWVRIMIIFFVVGLILLLVGIFLSVFIAGPFWWIFYALGGLFILGGLIILILVLLGLI
jgi:hypothetical protein